MVDSNEIQRDVPVPATISVGAPTLRLLNASREGFDLSWKQYMERLGAWLALQPAEVQRRVLFPLPGTVWIATAGREVDVQQWRQGQITDMGLADIRPPMSTVPQYARVSPPTAPPEPQQPEAKARKPRGGRR